MKKKMLIAAAVLALAFFVVPEGKNEVMTVDAASTATSSSVVVADAQSIVEDDSLTVSDKAKTITTRAGGLDALTTAINEGSDESATAVAGILDKLDSQAGGAASVDNDAKAATAALSGAAVNGASTVKVTDATAEIPSSVEEALTDVGSKLVCVDISLYDASNNAITSGLKIPVIVKISVPDGIDGNKAVVLHFNSDKTSAEIIEPKYVDGKLLFAVDHFSTFGIVEGTIVSEEEDSDDDTSSSNPWLDDLESMVANAADGATVTITRDMGINALPNSVMQELYLKQTVTLIMEYTYEGVDYTITIPAGAAVNSDIPCYGPLYLAAHYGSGVAVTAATATGAGTYTIKSGDTLSKIAKANGMQLSTLQQLNAAIAAQKYIYPGQVLTLK